MSRPPDTAVVIPARNEEARIGACLAALAGQGGLPFRVILAVNNTTDRTAAAACEAAGRLDLALTVLELCLPPGAGVGTARRIGCSHALCSLPQLRYLLTTDADCIVGPFWLERNIAHLGEVDAVCGKVDPIATEAGILSGMDPQLAELEGRYRALVQDFYARHAPGCADLAGTHGEAAGASLAFTRAAYLAVGGFAPLRTGEDRHIARRMRERGLALRHADDVTVEASCRLTGRASGGMSDALKARIGGSDYMIDDCLPPADWLIRRAGSGRLGSWPPQIPARSRLWVRDLPRHIETLETCRNSGLTVVGPEVLAAAMPWSRPGLEAPEWGGRTCPDRRLAPSPSRTRPRHAGGTSQPTLDISNPERSLK